MIEELAEATDAPEVHPTISWGIIGAGRIARHAMAPAIRKSGMGKLLAVASRSADRAEDLAEEMQADRAYVGYEELLADEDIQAVYIGLPNGLHSEWIERCAKAGKHILCEKSLTFTAAEARRLRGLCDEAGVLLMEAFMYRHHPQWKVVRRWLNDGQIGDLKWVEAKFFGGLSDTSDHRYSTDLGKGCLFDLTCYGVNVARYLIGSEPTSVKAHGDFFSDDVDLSSHIAMNFPGGILATAMGSFAVRGDQSVVLHGSTGRILVDKPFIPGTESVRLTLINGDGEKNHDVPGADQFTMQIRHFHKCLENGSMLAPGESGEENVAVLEAALASAKGL